MIVGVSFDSVADNAAFAEKFQFPYGLLCDTERTMGMAYGACDEPGAKHARRISYWVGPDGSVRNIMVRRSSGHKVLDDAAIRIVELAAPFAPFPDDILKEVDILHVTRTWKFLNSYQFSSR